MTIDPGDPVDLSFDTAHFRAVLGHFSTGIAVVTGVAEGVPLGLTCQSIVSLSLDPPLIAFCPSKASTSWPRIQSSGAFCVNILTQDQEDVSRVFATRGADKFQHLSWRAGQTGSAILGDVLAWVDCRIEAVHDGGDHLIVVGRVVGLAAAGSGKPLLTYRGGYGRFES
ncbi:MAG: flavin reductase family protein [Actinomycetota bacterium]|nr:flavin reductase family protein [Actinomycetota bacterium]